MSYLDPYIANIDQATIDVLEHPVFSSFIEESEVVVVTYDSGDGTQYQARALSKDAVGDVLSRLIEAARNAGVDLKDWICSPKNFDLCGKLDSTPGQLMRQLNDFLNNNWTQATTNTLGVIAAFSQLVNAVVLGKFLAILAALSFIGNEIINLCNCN